MFVWRHEKAFINFSPNTSGKFVRLVPALASLPLLSVCWLSKGNYCRCGCWLLYCLLRQPPLQLLPLGTLHSVRNWIPSPRFRETNEKLARIKSNLHWHWWSRSGFAAHHFVAIFLEAFTSKCPYGSGETKYLWINPRRSDCDGFSRMLVGRFVNDLLDDALQGARKIEENIFFYK